MWSDRRAGKMHHPQLLCWPRRIPTTSWSSVLKLLFLAGTGPLSAFLLCRWQFSVQDGILLFRGASGEARLELFGEFQPYKYLVYAGINQERCQEAEDRDLFGSPSQSDQEPPLRQCAGAAPVYTAVISRTARAVRAAVSKEPLLLSTGVAG